MCVGWGEAGGGGEGWKGDVWVNMKQERGRHGKSFLVTRFVHLYSCIIGVEAVDNMM
jgi:hypothetical protein